MGVLAGLKKSNLLHGKNSVPRKHHINVAAAAQAAVVVVIVVLIFVVAIIVIYGTCLHPTLL